MNRRGWASVKEIPMIERIATAIASKAPGLCASRNPKKFPCILNEHGECDDTPQVRCYCLLQAEAVIRALREPTGAMIDAGAESIGPISKPKWEGFPSKTWRAMLEAACR